MARLNLRPFLPLFLAAAGCADAVDSGEFEDPQADGGEYGDQDGTREPADFQGLSESEYAQIRADMYCEAVQACEPDVACHVSPNNYMAGDCQRYSPAGAAECLTDIHDRLLAMGEDPEDSECVVAMNPFACGWVITDDDSLPGCGESWPDEEGRPIQDHGTVLLADLVAGHAWANATRGTRTHAGAANIWSRAARSEHGSIASFARLSQELMAQAAPPDLIEHSHRAALDEVAHAQSCLEIARALGAGDIDLGAVPLPTPRVPTLADLAVEALREGCYGEGTAAVRASLAAQGCGGRIAEVLETIAEDETRHAQLAWSTLDWILGKDRGLAPLLTAEIAQIRRDQARVAMVDEEQDLSAYGVLGSADRAAIRLAVLEQLIEPTLDHLIAKHTKTPCAGVARVLPA